MKKSTGSLIFFVICGIILYWFTAHFVILTDEGFAILDKRFLKFEHSVVDIRNWTSQDFKANPEIQWALISQGYSEIVAGVTIAEWQEQAGQWMQSAKDSAGQLKNSVRQNVKLSIDKVKNALGFDRQPEQNQNQTDPNQLQ